ncbi:hypothetical protein D3C83_244350 [compost metagenome]
MVGRGHHVDFGAELIPHLLNFLLGKLACLLGGRHDAHLALEHILAGILDPFLFRAD